MSASVTLSIATNSVIAAAKGFGFLVTGSPTLFAETVHSLADVGNQILLKVGEVRGRAGPDALHPFGRGQEKFFWALVSAVSVFFIGCAINVYHGVVALLQHEPVEPFTPLVMGLLLFSLALEAWTFRVALKEIGGVEGARKNRQNVTVLACCSSRMPWRCSASCSPCSSPACRTRSGRTRSSMRSSPSSSACCWARWRSRSRPSTASS